MTLSSSYEITPRPPSVEDYLRLRRDSGLSPKTAEQATAAIAGSWAFRQALDSAGNVIGMGRIIGDGGWYFLVADMATLPVYQGQGIGSAILDELLRQVHHAVPAGAYITLTADPAGRRLYESRGFAELTPNSTAMHLLSPDPD